MGIAFFNVNTVVVVVASIVCGIGFFFLTNKKVEKLENVAKEEKTLDEDSQKENSFEDVSKEGGQQ